MTRIRSRSTFVRILGILSWILLQTACASAPKTKASSTEWEQLSADYSWIQTLRGAQPKIDPQAPRKQVIETLLENHRKIEPVWVPFMDRLQAYAERTGDVRATQLWANEMASLGDEYLDVLSRPDRALAIYRSALEMDPTNNSIRDKIARAERVRYVDRDAFDRISVGASEADVISAIGRPREDWIRQIRRDGHVYSVWIYPKSDGGAAAVYLDGQRVYHLNWDASPAPGNK